MAKKKKLNSMRLLEANDIPYQAFEYDTGFHDAMEVAEMIGAPEFAVYKTLIVESANSSDVYVVMVASDRELDLKKVASAVGEKKVKMAKQSDAEKMTGLQVGGISPLMLMDKNWIIVLDSPATQLQNIYISAGQRGMQLGVPVTPLMNLLKARIADVSTEMSD